MQRIELVSGEPEPLRPVPEVTQEWDVSEAPEHADDLAEETGDLFASLTKLAVSAGGVVVVATRTALESSERLGDLAATARLVATAGRNLLGPAASLLAEPSFVRKTREDVNRFVAAAERRARDAREENERIARGVVERTLRVVVDSVLDHVDVDAVIAKADIARVIDRLDLDDIVRRVDVDALIERVDLGAIVERLDLPRITEQVMDEVDIGEVIRESTGSIAGETVDAVRYQGMNLDRFLARIVDRVLMRTGERDADGAPPADRATDRAADRAEPDTTSPAGHEPEHPV
ncbi:MAG TPA: hypothetical protein VGH10_01915 [Actinomycetota bacterium]